MKTPAEIQAMLDAAAPPQPDEIPSSANAAAPAALADPDDVPPYTSQPADRGCEVVNTSGDVVVTCANAQIAEQYIGLLTQAFRRGYKAGFRIGKGRRSGKS